MQRIHVVDERHPHIDGRLHPPSVCVWQYVTVALHDIESLALVNGQLGRVDDSIIELENKASKALNEYRGGSNLQQLQQQKTFDKEKEGDGFVEGTRPHTNVMGCSGQKLRKSVDAKELSKDEQPKLSRSDKRARTPMRSSVRRRPGRRRGCVRRSLA
jgi:hypothetical protein